MLNIALEKLDFFRYANFFYFNARRRMYSLQGVLASFLIYAILIYLFIQSDAILKTNPQISDQIVAHSEASIPVNNKNFAPIINFYDDQGNNFLYIDPSILTIVVYFNKMTYQLHNCTSDDFIGGYVKSDYYESALCIDRNLKLVLISSSTQYVFINLKVFMCSNNTFNGTCKSEEYIRNYLNGKNFFFNFLESSFDLNSYDNPMIIDQVSGYVRSVINVAFSQRVTLSFMQISLYDDKNLIYPQEEPSIYYQQDENYRNFDFYYKENDNENDKTLPLIDYRIIASNKQRVLTRKYQKLTDLLGKLGGLASLLKVVGNLFVWFFVKLKLIKNTINNLYSLPKTSEKLFSSQNSKKVNPLIINTEIMDLRTNINKQSEEKKKTLRSQTNLDKEANFKEKHKKNEKNQNLQKDLFNNPERQSLEILELDDKKINSESPTKEEIKFGHTDLYAKEEKLEFSTFSYLKNMLKSAFGKKLDHKGQLIVRATNIYEKEFDVISILKRLKDIEKLKMFLFNDRQLKLFELIEKPEIPFEHDNRINLNIESQMSLQNVIRDSLFEKTKIVNQKKKIILQIISEYELMEQSSLSDIDKKLLSYFNS